MSTCMVIKSTSFTKYRNCLKDVKCENVIIYHQYCPLNIVALFGLSMKELEMK